MANLNGTGIQYPTLELGGVTYTVKFSRGGILYRLSKSGTNLSDLRAGSGKSFATVIDVLHAALFDQYMGDAESLAELVMSEDKIALASEVVSEALKKVFPPTPVAAPPADQPAAVQ